jgi:hypothetical protein
MNTQPLTPQSAGITGPMNINAVITHLIEMTPSQRKQFAQIHMDDPMMLSAAKFVDNQVNKQAQSLAAQRTGAAPPPVNQQAVAQMTGSALPENTGIAQLPAENMPSEYAKGGIVAFSGKTGSNVEEEPVSMVGQLFNSVGDYIGNQYERNKLALKQLSDYGAAEGKRREAIPGLFEALTPSQKAARTEQMRAASAEKARIANTPLQASDTSSRVDDRQRRDPSLYAPEKEVSPAARRDDRPDLSSLKGQTDKPLSRSDNTGGGGGPRVDTSPTAPVASTYKETPYVPEKSEGLEKLLKGYQDAQGAAVDPYAAQHEESRKSREQMALDEMAGAKERQAGIKKLLSDKEARIKQREERLNQQDDVNLNMSLINAGLSMMQSTGKGLAGIAEGAQKGVGQYTEGLKMSEAARQKIEEARDAHDDLRFNLNNMSSKEIQAAKRSMEEGKIVSTNEAITAIMHQEGLNRADATALFAARVNQIASDKQLAYNAAEAARNREYQSGENRAQQTFTAAENAKARAASAAQAGASLALHERIAKMPGQYQQLYTALGKGDIVKGYEIAMSGKQEGSLEATKLRIAKDIVNNAVTPSQRSSEEYKNAQRTLQNALRMSGLNTGNVPNDMLMSRPD